MARTAQLIKEKSMVQDIVFILPSDFEDAGQQWYCRECTEVVGLLAYFPQLHDVIDVRMVDYPRPRLLIAEELGSDAHQNCPMLIAADSAPIDGVTFIEVNGRKIVDGAKQIGLYLAARHGINGPHP
jgi:Protein of unknown function (DUF3088)